MLLAADKADVDLHAPAHPTAVNWTAQAGRTLALAPVRWRVYAARTATGSDSASAGHRGLPGNRRDSLLGRLRRCVGPPAGADGLLPSCEV
jgi:hypothetical protein